ncbi:Tripeptide aminopeptidase [Fructilactobacillus florum 8D]|uniref:Peptidase T n=1 Tax=Fructilactobacillus florum 8D TaxID=1221538 RepID=W9EFC8_9LACO|nr:peptidase T [Fructilactobacillus florum]ETO40787.1 Tripeptide aminopeptidase [Fructilactobacillus florum 8D]
MDVNTNELRDRFLRYVRVNTRSNPTSQTIPSDQKEVAFLADLKEELQKLGLQNVRTNKQSGYVFAELPATDDAPRATLGLIAHVDTADFNSEHVNPQIIKNYDGHSVIKLDATGNYRLDPAVFPNLKNYTGQTLITTDGSTLLGADDKAGVAEIMTALQLLKAHPETKHGRIVVGFGPDEEIGTGADHFDANDFGADFAYTIDGGPLGDLQYETFNAAAATVTFKGTNVHPSEAKDVLVNASQLAINFHEQLPKHDRPEHTAGREGFFFLTDIAGNCDEATLNYIIRDFDRQKFEDRKQLFTNLVAQQNQQFGTPRVHLELTDQYYNMGEVLKKDLTPVELAKKSMEQVGITPHIFPVRGGTDGSKISFMGIPTPNIFAGPENMHGRFEFVSLQTMEQAVRVIIQLAQAVPTR